MLGKQGTSRFSSARRSLWAWVPQAVYPLVRGWRHCLSGASRQNRILDQYLASAPDPQLTLDIFKGEWVCMLPGPFAGLQAGVVPAFEDQRIAWGVRQLGDLTGKSVLELGPFEGGHTYMLERLGAGSIVAVEANTRSYLKCLVIKELLELRHARFLYGDFVEYLRANQTKFDYCVASGVLYHMRNPVELVELIARASDRLLLWTHYYDSQAIAPTPHVARRFSQGVPAEQGGFHHTLYPYYYDELVKSPHFCGGNRPSSHWLDRADLFACLQHFGFTDIQVNFDHPHHPNGPSLALIAVRH